MSPKVYIIGDKINGELENTDLTKEDIGKHW